MSLARWKPAAPVWVHVLVAASLWTAVGTLLGVLGVTWALGAAAPGAAWILAGALAVGLAKGLFVLRRTAQKNLERILERGDGRCLGGFLSWRSWLLVGVMMVTGRLLRGGLLPRPTVGFVYAAVGMALLAGSSALWRGLARVRARPRTA